MEQNQFYQSPMGTPPQKFNFTGSFGEFFLYAIGLIILSIITLGLVFPYFIYWINKYFFANLELGGRRVIFTGKFADYFVMSLGLLFLSVLTFGLAFPYWIYWNGKYFSSNLELQQ
ncbi:MAG: DUF898 family protein [Bacteroidota bacterium]|jgi:uncharacterized membrane protein YjgN (DUF898 family)